MRMPFMGPSGAEVTALAQDLLDRFGAQAREEAQHLQNVAVTMGSPRNRNLYRRVAKEIEKRFQHGRSAPRMVDPAREAVEGR